MIKKIIHKLLVKLGLRSDYGFTQLMYQGKPVVLRDDMPTDTIGFINEDTSKVRVLNWKTGKVGKTMTYKQFYAWIARENKRIKAK